MKFSIFLLFVFMVLAIPFDIAIAITGQECTWFQLQNNEVENANWLTDHWRTHIDSIDDKLSCGLHEYPSGTDAGDGCPDGTIVFSFQQGSWYKCDASIEKWSLYSPFDCDDDLQTVVNKYYHSYGNYYRNTSSRPFSYFYHYGVGVSAGDICSYPLDKLNDIEKGCVETDGLFSTFRLSEDTPSYVCWCDDELYENDGPYKCKPKSKYNYKSCSSNADCTRIDNTKRPYLHSTAWKCIEQTAGVRVCAAKECESGWTPINGYCQESKTTQTPQSENKNAVSGGKTEKKMGVTKTCTDSNMDANCKCIVPGTVEWGGVCVCTDFNKEIKGGKCEYTAAYRLTLKADIDSKYSKIKSLTAGFEANKWRDAEGNFNTARLASDSIAGVVLGTVGGVVTASLVKKSQVKKGFEDIQCHIGGQSVANFGDVFVVGR